MKVQHRQRLEITLDIFRGCKHACAGCMIDKVVGGDVDDLPALHALMQEMIEAGYVAFDLGMGPTDYMSSENTVEVMTHPQFQAMAQLFHQVTFNAAFLEKDLARYADMVADIDAAVPGKPIRFLIPATPAFFKTGKFGRMIERKLDFIQRTFQSAYLNEAGFVVSCTDETMAGDFDAQMKKGFEVEFPVDKDDILSIPYGRSPQKDLVVAQQILRTSRRISAFYSGLSGEDERRCNPDLHLDTGTMVNLLYTGGTLYWVPFLKDDCPFIDPEFVIPRPWTMAHLLEVRSKALEASLEYVGELACGDCPYLSSCSEKGITSIMRRMSIRDCLVGLEYADESKRLDH